MISDKSPEDIGERREARKQSRGCIHPCSTCKCPENLQRGAESTSAYSLKDFHCWLEREWESR